MNDDDLFDWATSAYARRSDPETSHEAAESVRQTELENITFVALWEYGEKGATVYELVEKTGLPLVTVSPRLAPLCRKGYAEDTGLRRPGPSGRNCIVWRVITKHKEPEAGATAALEPDAPNPTLIAAAKT